MRNGRGRMLLTVLLLLLLPVYGAAATEDGMGYLVVTDTVEANTEKDVAPALQAMIDAHPNRTLFFPDGEYIVSTPLLLPANPAKSVSLKLADFAVIRAGRDFPEGEAVIQMGGKDPANDTHSIGSNYSIEGGVIHGGYRANGISVHSGRETSIRNVSIKNTVVGIHILYGANSGSSDADIFGVSIIGTGVRESVGILLEGMDNTLTNIRIGNVFTGVYLKSSGNMLRNVHPLFTSSYKGYADSCGFLETCGNNWYDYCYSDQFATGFRSASRDDSLYGASVYNNCFCFWYSDQGGSHIAYRADGRFNATLDNFKIGFKNNKTVNVVLSVGEEDGRGVMNNLMVDAALVTHEKLVAP